MTTKLPFQNTHSGFKFLKNEKIDTLLPAAALQNNTNSTINMEVPIFYNVKNETFSVFLTDSFFKDINLKEIENSGTDYSNGYSTYTDKDSNTFIYFSYPTLAELRNANNNAQSGFSRFKEKYENHLLDIKNGELVIFISFKNQHSSQLLRENVSSSLTDVIKKSIQGSRSEFEFFKAYKFNNKYYLLNTKGEIDQNQTFRLDKNSMQYTNNLVIPYTDKDWDLANNIFNKILEVKSKINANFAQQKQIGQLDKPFSENQLSLEDLTNQKKAIRP